MASLKLTAAVRNDQARKCTRETRLQVLAAVRVRLLRAPHSCVPHVRYLSVVVPVFQTSYELTISICDEMPDNTGATGCCHKIDAGAWIRPRIRRTESQQPLPMPYPERSLSCVAVANSCWRRMERSTGQDRPQPLADEPFFRMI